ncbi:hypothetical protein DM01DRAFT_1374764 [Hesseltinella vesiculosa]|uniref:Uncharacterized protein n=1 Tax=Hesseltinella vesiculosa TaxID=101127 RepID=A0A1X2GFN5_9FUNG|nr:hypothetical protein DM01DRAFT_1374764 [Hesseltinella vesiculosa]
MFKRINKELAKQSIVDTDLKRSRSDSDDDESDQDSNDDNSDEEANEEEEGVLVYMCYTYSDKKMQSEEQVKQHL